MKKLLLALAAGCAGASGLGLETLLLQVAGLALGYGRASAVGLSTFIAAWAVGAYAAGRSRGAPQRELLGLGLLLGAAAGPLVAIAMRVSSAAPGTPWPALVVIASIASIGVLQGAALPLVCRSMEAVSTSPSTVRLAVASNLAGSVAGAYAIGDRAVALWGRIPAAWIGGASALLAGILAWSALRGESPARTGRLATATDPDAVDPHARAGEDLGPRGASGGELRRAFVVVGLATVWMSSVQWVGLRLGVLWLDGMQAALTSILCASLATLATGAWILPRVLPRDARGPTWLLAGCAAATLWPVCAAPAMGWLDGAWALARRGALEGEAGGAVESVPYFLRALVLVGPSMLPFGALIPVLHRALARTRTEAAERLGRLYLHEAWGALIGIPLVHAYVVPRFGLNGALAAALAVGALAIATSFGASFGTRSVLTALSLASAAWIARATPIARGSPPLSNPALSVRALAEDRDFCVAVVDDGIHGERTLLTDGFRAAGTGLEYRYMRVLGHLPLLLHARPRNVAVLALGTGTTVGAVALDPRVERIEVLELSRAVVEMAPWFVEHNRGALAEGLPGLLSDRDANARVVVRLGDGRALLADARRRFDVLTMEPLLPDAPAAVYLYTPEFYSIAKRSLAEGGLACQWVPPHALEPSTFEAVLDAFASAFEWSSVWLFGSQAILIGGERAPELDASRFEALPEALATELADLGLDAPARLVARYVGDGARWRTAERPLSDRDPWIVHRPRRSGPVLLADLPENLAELRRRAGDPPPTWVEARGHAHAAASACHRVLRAAREAHARSEAELRGWRAWSRGVLAVVPVADLGALEGCGDDPEVRAFQAELLFLEKLRAGVALLASGGGSDFAARALPVLLEAAEARRERGDVHAYVAVALERIGSPAARRAAETARERCPSIARTREGRRARALGLSDELWSVLSGAP